MPLFRDVQRDPAILNYVLMRGCSDFRIWEFETNFGNINGNNSPVTIPVMRNLA